MKSLINFLLFLVDFSHKKKIFNYLKIIFKKKPLIIVDIGAHKGESVKIFFKFFNIKKIICYEASQSNFKVLKRFIRNFKVNKSKIKIYNFGIGSRKSNRQFNQTAESSSSTFAKINYKSRYFIKKNNILKFFFGKQYVSNSYRVKLTPLGDELAKHKLKIVDLLKIDTEGFEYEVIKGLGKKISLVKYIYFEHHFDQMIIKNYTYRKIHLLLKRSNFQKIFKIKMPFRKTFEYIYVNKNII
jgi:FkbM family methyltransferase